MSLQFNSLSFLAYVKWSPWDAKGYSLNFPSFLSQLTEAGHPGVTGRDARRPVEQAIKYKPEHAPILFQCIKGKIVKDN